MPEILSESALAQGGRENGRAARREKDALYPKSVDEPRSVGQALPPALPPVNLYRFVIETRWDVVFARVNKVPPSV